MSEIGPQPSMKQVRSLLSPIDAEIRRNYVNALWGGLFSNMAGIETYLTLDGNIGHWLISGGGATIYPGRCRLEPKKARR
jgi:hypothetical protein